MGEETSWRKHPGGNSSVGGNDWEQYSPCIYCRFPTVFSPQIIIILNVKSQVQIFLKKASEKQDLERK